MTPNSRTQRARAAKLLAEDALLDRHEAAALVGGMAAENWPRYAERWPALLAGARVVRVKPGSRGRMRWLKSAVIEHVRSELLRPDADAALRPLE